MDLRKPDEIVDLGRISLGLTPLAGSPGETRFVTPRLVLTGLLNGALVTHSVNQGDTGFTIKDQPDKLITGSVETFAVEPASGGTKVRIAALTAAAPAEGKDGKAVPATLRILSVDAASGAVKDEKLALPLARKGASVRWTEEGITFAEMDPETGKGTLSLAALKDGKGGPSLPVLWRRDIDLTTAARPSKDTHYTGVNGHPSLKQVACHVRVGPDKYLLGYLNGAILPLDISAEWDAFIARQQRELLNPRHPSEAECLAALNWRPRGSELEERFRAELEGKDTAAPAPGKRRTAAELAKNAAILQEYFPPMIREASVPEVGSFALRDGLLAMAGINGACFFRVGPDGRVKHIGNLANADECDMRPDEDGVLRSFNATPLPAKAGMYDYFFTTSDSGEMSLLGYRKEAAKAPKADAKHAQ